MQAINTGIRLLTGTLILSLASCATPSDPPGSEVGWKVLETAAATTSEKSRVALDTALNALGNAMAEVDALRKTLVDDLYQGRSDQSAQTARALKAAWKGEQKAVTRVHETSVALAVCTHAAAQVSALRLQAADVADGAQAGRLYREADAASREAGKAARSAAAIAEDLKQEWLVAVPPAVEE